MEAEIAKYAENLVCPDGRNADADEVSRELIRFLTVRVLHKDDVLPGVTLRTLWDRVMTDTRLCAKIYDALNGGNMIHCSQTPADMFRVSLAMSEMLQQGWEPVLRYWTDNNNDIKRTTIDGVTMFVTKSMTFADIEKVSNSLANSLAKTNRGKKRKNSNVGSGLVRVSVVYNKEKTVYTIRADATVADLKQDIRDHEQVPVDQITLMFGDLKLGDHDRLNARQIMTGVVLRMI